MKSNNIDSLNGGSSDEYKEQNIKYNLSKFEYDLYHEEDNVVEKIIRVKRFATNKTEKWKVFEDNKVILTIDGAKLTNKEKEFFRGVDGVNFLILQCKQGIKSFNSLKNELRKKLKII